MLTNIEKGDIVVIKLSDGSTASVTVLSVKPDYEHPGSFARFDYINHNDPSPMRRTAWPKELLSILRKSAVKTVDPKAERPSDNAQVKKSNEVVIDGKRYVEKVDNKSDDVGSVINQEAAPQVHAAVTSPAKPVISRIKKAAVVSK